MGSPLSGLLADLFMNHLETTKIQNSSNPFQKNIIYWYRYVDDIICLFEGSEIAIEDFFQYLNSIHNKIKFTKEIQKQDINFLDLTVSNTNNKHDFKIYRKQCQSDLIIPISSNHPWQHKMASIQSMIHRLLKIPMSEENIKKEIETIKYISSQNGYNNCNVDSMLEKAKRKINNNNSILDKKDYICLPYSKILNKSIRKGFYSKFKISYKTNQNSFKIIQHSTKPNKEDKLDKSGIYRINCSDCSNYYIGQTGRSFRTRFKEHIQALKSQNLTSQKSNFAEHLLNSGHNYKNINENLKILDLEIKGNKMDSKEELFIYLHSKEDKDNILNNQQIDKENPIFKLIRKVNHK